MSAVEIIADMPIGEYHALPRLSSSMIGDLLTTPAHLKAKVWGEPSPSMRIGSAVHLMVLEPHLVSSLIPVAPDVNKRTKAGKAEWADWEAGLPRDAVQLTASEREMAVAAAQAILTEEGVRKSELLVGRTELTILFEIDGCPAKARLDVFNKHRIITDLKTARSASKKAFAKSVHEYGYHRQESLYTMAACAAELDPAAFWFLVVETSQAMLRSETKSEFVAVYQTDMATQAQGEKDVFRAAKIYRECLESGVWPGYPKGIQTVSLPIYAFDFDED